MPGQKSPDTASLHKHSAEQLTDQALGADYQGFALPSRRIAAAIGRMDVAEWKVKDKHVLVLRDHASEIVEDEQHLKHSH